MCVFLKNLWHKFLFRFFSVSSRDIDIGAGEGRRQRGAGGGAEGGAEGGAGNGAGVVQGVVQGVV